MARTKRVVVKTRGQDNISYRAASRVVKAVHVSQDETGEWVVRKAGRNRLFKFFPDRDSAMAFVEKAPSLRNSTVIVHEPEGGILTGKIARTRSGERRLRIDESILK